MTANHGQNKDDSFTPTFRDESASSDLGVVALSSTEQIAARYWPETGTVYFPAIDPTKIDPSKKGRQARGRTSPAEGAVTGQRLQTL